MTVPSTTFAGTAASADGAVRCVCTTMTTTSTRRTTTPATMPPSRLRRRRWARARSAASAARRAAIRSRLLRRVVSAGTGVLLGVCGIGDRPSAERERGGRAPGEGESDEQQDAVAEDFQRVGGLPRGHLAAVAEAAAVDLQATGPGRPHGGD